jgi:hypothetical protein
MKKNEEVIRLSWKKCDKALDAIVPIIAWKGYKQPNEIKDDDGNKNCIKLKRITTISFFYRIAHIVNLSSVKLNQLSTLNFYHTSKKK